MSALPLLHVHLDKPKGAFKPCLWCKSEYASFQGKRASDPEFHGARVICESCGRQIAWASAAQVRRAERLRMTFPILPNHLKSENARAA